MVSFANIQVASPDGNVFLVHSKPRRSLKWKQFVKSVDWILVERHDAVFEKQYLKRFIELVYKTFPGVKVNEPVFRTRLFLQRELRRPASMDRLAPAIKAKAFPFQLEDIQKALCLQSRCFLAQEMGCGKTLIALGVVSCHRHEMARHLVICPSYLRGNWWKEIGMWLNGDAQVIFKTKDVIQPTAEIVVISYDLAVRKIKELSDIKWTTIILDESHYVKSRAAKRTKTLAKMIQSCSKVLLLSGTPALSRPVELYTQVCLLYPNLFRTFTAYAKRYCDLRKTSWGWDSNGSSNEDELSAIMSKIMIRRLKKDVLKELPDKIRKEVSVPLSKKERRELDTMFAELQGLNDRISANREPTQETRALSFKRQAHISEMFRVTARAKLKGVADYVEGLVLDNDEPFVLFGYHRITLDALEAMASKHKISYIRIDGSTPQMDRQDMIDLFQSGQKRLAILSIGACNSGITLTKCSTMVFAELTWTPSLLLQAEDRIHRIGQNSTCQYHYLIADGSLDERVFRKVHEKFALVDKIIDAGRNAKGYDVEETERFDRVMEEEEDEPAAKKRKRE